MERGNEGVCWYGACLTRYTEQEDWSQRVHDASKAPRHIRKRDVTSVKGVTVTKTSKSAGDSGFTTKSVETTKSVKTSNSDDGTSSGSKDFKGHFITSFSSSHKGGANVAPIVTNPDVDPFSLKNVPSGSNTHTSFFSSAGQNQHVSKTVKNGDVKVKVYRGPNGEKVTTHTVRRLVITRGPTKTVKRIIITKEFKGGRANSMPGGTNTVTTKTVSLTRGSMRGTNGLMMGGNNGLNTKTARITTVKTVNTGIHPLASIQRTFKQERIATAPNFGGLSAATKTVSTLSVTKKEQPSLSVVRVTSEGVTPSSSRSLETANTATPKGLEVELPGYTAGLRHNWKWVLARRVGMYPPYVQVLDPDVLFYKLGLRKPSLPSLPVVIQDILKRVPVHPVGSDLYGFLLSSRILEKIRGFTDGVNGLSRLRSILSTSNTSQLNSSKFLKNLLSGDQPSPSGSNLLQKILLASSLSGIENIPLTSPGYPTNPYGGLFSGAYAESYGSPWSKFPIGQFPGNTWPLFGGGPTKFGGLGRTPEDYPESSIGLYDFLGSKLSLRGARHTLSDDEGLLPSAGTHSAPKEEHLRSVSNYIKSLLAHRGTGSERTYRRFDFSSDNSPVTWSDKLANILEREKLRNLQNILKGQNSPILRDLYSEHSDHSPVSLKRSRALGNTRLYKIILHQLLGDKHTGLLGPSKFKTSYGTESDNTEDLLSRLRYLTGKDKDETSRYTSTPRTQHQVLELLNGLRKRRQNSRHSILSKIFNGIERPRQEAASYSATDSSDATEVIEDILSGREPSSDRAAEIRKEITRALLNSGHGPVPSDGRRGTRLSKLVSVHGTSHTEPRPQGLAESRVISATYHTTKEPATVPTRLMRTMAPALQVSPSITQLSTPATLLGVNSLSTAASGSSTFQPYSQLAPQTLYSTEGSAILNQPALLNRQFLSSTGSVYGNSLTQPANTMIAGTGGYSSYATLPSNAAYISQYSMQPYYIGTSLYGSHPHYIVEGHEAPGTRWQLRVWRHRPGVSAVVPGYASFGSSHLGSMVTRARETVTRGMQVGSQPGQFGFASYGPSIPGGSLIGTQSQGDVSGLGGSTSQYVVRSPDGSLVVTRQPLGYGSQTSNVIVSRTTKETTKTTGAGLPTGTGGILNDSFQTAVGGESSGGSVSSTKYKIVKEQFSTAGDAKSESLPELTQRKDSSLLSALASDRVSQNAASSISTDGSSSGSTGVDSDLSQSKLRR